MQTDPVPFNVHPTAAGYTVITNQIIPGPGAAVVIAMGAAFVTRRRRPMVSVGVCSAVAIRPLNAAG